MVFSSLSFIFIFLPIFLIVYYLIPSNKNFSIRLKNAIIFLGSIIFYSIGALKNPLYILLILFSVLINYLAGLIIDKNSVAIESDELKDGTLLNLLSNYSIKRKKKTWFIISLIYNFLWLFIFKYADFFLTGISKIASILPEEQKTISLRLLLPLGISFYTFQAVSYITDIYIGKYKAEKNFIDFGTYLIMFPQLIAGPIVTYDDIKNDLKSRDITYKKSVMGLKTFIIGLGLKVILANNLSGLFANAQTIGFESISTPLAWITILGYTFQIYFDFFGYSLMAIGLGKMLGFTLPENFNNPYISKSMTEFWRRWHITLGSWFREYVYIPLGGNRRGKTRTYFNLFIVWTLTGFWHGAHLNFIIWGLFLFIVMAIEKLGLKKILDKIKPLGHIYMFLLIPISWTIFAITDITELQIFFVKLFPFLSEIFKNASVHIANAVSFDGDFIKYIKEYITYLLAGVIFSTPLPKKLYCKYKNSYITNILLLLIFWVSIYCLYKGLNDPFLYFRF